MAKCDDCGRDMFSADGCTKITIKLDGIVYDRIPYGGYGRCGDCNCLLGHIHHAGCDLEKCPKCATQLLSCDCEKS